MPFIWRREHLKLDRSNKRPDGQIDEQVEKALADIFNHHKLLPNMAHIKILPTERKDAPFKKADPKSFLTVYLVRELDLSLYEVEHWLDIICPQKDQHKFRLEMNSVVDVDERRMYYKTSGGYVSVYLINRK